MKMVMFYHSLIYDWNHGNAHFQRGIVRELLKRGHTGEVYEPADHRAFYNRQRLTKNITRLDMIWAGCSPSVRLFEPAVCGTPIISNYWDGLDSLFEFNTEILVARSAAGLHDGYRLRELSEAERLAIREQVCQKVLSAHTAAHRAAGLETYARHLLRLEVN